MQIAELFVKLGIKDADKSSKELSKVGKTLGEVKTSALALKAGILGALYGLEQLMSGSMKTGSELSNFSAVTGISALQLQKWQYASRQAGISAEATAGSFKNVQDVVTKLAQGHAPEGFGLISKFAKEGFNIEKATKDPIYALKQIQSAYDEMGKKGISIGLKNQAIVGMGMGALLPGMAKGVYTDKNFNRSPIYSEKEISKLNKTSVAWEEMVNKFQMAIGKITAKEGLPMVRDISKAADSTIELIQALVELSEKIKIFTILGDSLKVVSESIKSITGTLKGGEEGISAISKSIKTGKVAPVENWTISASKKIESQWMSVGKSMYNLIGAKHWDPWAKETKAPPKVSSQSKTTHNTANVTQNLHFSGVSPTDAQATANIVKKTVKDAHRQIPQRQDR